MSCPHCHESARFVEYRPKTAQSLVGTFALERAYYHCRSCGQGSVPWDETLDLSRQTLTPGARQVVCIAGAVDSFAEAADVVLKKLAGLRVSESTVERTSEVVGHDIGQRLEAGETFGACTPWHWHKDAEGKTCAYVSLDLTGLAMQGPDGAAAEGRMAAVGMIYNPVPEDAACRSRASGRVPRFQARYVAGLRGQASLAEPLRRQAAQVGMDQAQRWIALSDAGAGVEDLLRGNFGRVEAVILDFYHAAEHLGDLGRALYPGDDPSREEWIGQWCHRLKHEGGAVVLEQLRTLATEGREAVRIRPQQCCKTVPDPRLYHLPNAAPTSVRARMAAPTRSPSKAGRRPRSRRGGVNMNISQRTRGLRASVYRHFEFTRLQDRSMACAYEALIPVVQGRPRTPLDRPGEHHVAAPQSDGPQSFAAGA